MKWLCTLAAVALTGLTVTPASAQSGDFLAALSATRASDPGRRGDTSPLRWKKTRTGSHRASANLRLHHRGRL